MIKDLFVAFVRSGSLTDKIFESSKLLGGLVISEIILDSTSKGMVLSFLNEKCRRHNLSNNTVISRWQDVYTEGNNDVVFYKVPKSEPTIFWYKGFPIVCDDRRHNRSTCIIKFIRGTVDLAELVTEAREYNRPTTNAESKDVNYYSYQIIEHSGSSGNSADPRPKLNRGTSVTSLPESSDEESTHETQIYKTDTILNYTAADLTIKRRTKNPFDEYYYPQEVLDLVNDTNEWLKRREWFINRGLPWKRGILIHGPGGTGKSSFAKTLGQRFGLPVNHMYLSNMTDYDFKQAWESAVANAPSIVLLEDFDAVFNKRVAVNPKSKLNFDTVLNTISGIQDSTGIILIITTNKIECIDEAIGVEANTKGISSRPGRIDKVLYLGAMNDENRRKLITKILLDWPDLIERAFEDSTGYTPAQVQEVCIQYALQKLHEEK